ncbi:MAG TPA: hypothetical protein VN739_03990 [Nitrososphaerales archaeon]|nr:hypothetical protein [Nitrososphaerales archaeon]
MKRITPWKDLANVPSEACEYKLYAGKKLLRNGSSCDCKRRLREHKKKIKQATGFTFQLARSARAARIIERLDCLIQRPPMNKRCG